MSASPCLGCASAARRFQHSKPKLYCQRFHCLATARCIDYRSKPNAIATALEFLKRNSIQPAAK